MKTTVRKHTRRTAGNKVTDVVEHLRQLSAQESFASGEINKKDLKEIQNSDPLYSKPIWTENEVHTIMNRINHGKIKPNEIFKLNPALEYGEGVQLTYDQNKKGLDFLKKRTFNVKGEIKDSSELREREASIISDKNAVIKLKDFYSERGNFYVPLYVVLGNDTSMEYYYLNGKINIIG